MTNVLTYQKMWQCLLALEKLLIGCFCVCECVCVRLTEGGPLWLTAFFWLPVILPAWTLCPPLGCLRCLLSVGTKPWQSESHCRARLPTESASVLLLLLSRRAVSHPEAREVSRGGVISVWVWWCHWFRPGNACVGVSSCRPQQSAETLQTGLLHHTTFVEHAKL